MGPRVSRSNSWKTNAEAVIRLEVDISEVESLGEDYRRGTLIGMRRIMLQGEALMVQEVPVATGNLRQGVGSDFDEESLSGEVYITAKRDAMGPRQATVHLASGRTKSVTLRAQPEFNYAEVVAKGRRAQLAPSRARAFLVPVSSPPARGSYLTSEGQTFVARRSLLEVLANPFDRRTATALEQQIEPIMDRALEQALNR